MIYLIIGIIVAAICMSQYDWPSKDEIDKFGAGPADYIPIIIWIVFIVALWPIAVGVIVLSQIFSYFAGEK